MDLLDIGASIIVVTCIWMAFSVRWLWLLYASACLVIAVVDYKIGLYGQSGMNAIIFIVAIKNFFKKEGKNAN
jgi:hypothetical protein